MADWTKITKQTDGNQGFLQKPGFLVAGFLTAVSKWLKITKPTDSWTKITKAS